MKKDTLQINKTMIPYSFNILLADELFNLTINHNEKHDIFTIAVKKDDETVCEGEPIIYGVPLFHDVYMAGKSPAVDIIPIDESGERDTVTYTNLNETVFLTIDNAGGGNNE